MLAIGGEDLRDKDDRLVFCPSNGMSLSQVDEADVPPMWWKQSEEIWVHRDDPVRDRPFRHEGVITGAYDERRRVDRFEVRDATRLVVIISGVLEAKHGRNDSVIKGLKVPSR